MFLMPLKYTVSWTLDTKVLSLKEFQLLLTTKTIKQFYWKRLQVYYIVEVQAIKIVFMYIFVYT